MCRLYDVYIFAAAAAGRGSSAFGPDEQGRGIRAEHDRRARKCFFEMPAYWHIRNGICKTFFLQPCSHVLAHALLHKRAHARA